MWNVRKNRQTTLPQLTENVNEGPSQDNFNNYCNYMPLVTEMRESKITWSWVSIFWASGACMPYTENGEGLSTTKFWWLNYSFGGLVLAWFVSACPLKGSGLCKWSLSPYDETQLSWWEWSFPWWQSIGHERSLNGLTCMNILKIICYGLILTYLCEILDLGVRCRSSPTSSNTKGGKIFGKNWIFSFQLTYCLRQGKLKLNWRHG